jgi:hypothetical protein
MKKLAILLLLSTQIFVSGKLLAQAQKTKNTFEIEIDPIAYLLKGYSLHAIYQPAKFRFDLATYGLQIPGKLQGKEGFNLKMQGFGGKVHYLLQGTKGFYTGLGIGYSLTEATHKESKVQDKGKFIGIGPELGYRLFFKKPKDGIYKGLYLQPWISYGYSISLNKIEFEHVNYNQNPWEYFITFHIGYRF